MSPTKYIGDVVLVGGPERGRVLYAGWHAVREDAFGTWHVDFPKMSSIRDARDPETKFLWLKPVHSTLRRA